MANKSKNFVIDLRIYPFDVMVSLGETDEQLFKTLGKTTVDENEYNKLIFRSNSVKGRAVMFATGQSVIRLTDTPETNSDYATLQHEIFHIVTFIMNRVGMKLSINKSCEAYAYMIEYLTKEIYDKL